MVRAIKQIVRIQPGGRVELVSADLPEGAEAEVIVLLTDKAAASGDCLGLFADEPETIDRIVAEALADRETPLRQTGG